MTVRSEDFGRGPRIVVPLGRVDHVLTIAEATELREKDPRPYGEWWFDPDEIDQLRVVP